eukprot:172704-Alexandrium_andersonii.AAC.1
MASLGPKDPRLLRQANVRQARKQRWRYRFAALGVRSASIQGIAKRTTTSKHGKTRCIICTCCPT